MILTSLFFVFDVDVDVDVGVQGNTEGKLKRQRVIRRMDVELNDYPGSGANNRHTPTPKPGKGCVDCN